MEAKQLVMSEAEQAPPPEPTVPEANVTAGSEARVDELCRNLLDPQVRSELAKLGIEINLTDKLQSKGNGASRSRSNESGQLSQTLAEVKNFAIRIGGLEKLKEMVNMLISLKE